MNPIIIASLVAVVILIGLVLGAIAVEDLVKSMKKDKDQRKQPDSR